MKIVVLVKEVPDTYGARKLSLETGLAERGASEPVMDEINERAIEVALSYADANAGHRGRPAVDGPRARRRPPCARVCRWAPDRRCRSSTRVCSAPTSGCTAEVLAAALRKIGFDLVVAGNLSTDGSGGVVPAMVAELLDVPAATGLSEVAHRGRRRHRSPDVGCCVDPPLGVASRGDLDHRSASRRTAPELQGDDGGQEGAVRDPRSRRPRSRRGGPGRGAIDRDRA